jgi:hypothetical protein
MLREPFFEHSSSGSWEVEFPVWLLCKDGLKVPPFSHHETGDESLQNLGMDAASWERWFRRVISAHNLCLSWDVKEPEACTWEGEPGELMRERNRNLYLWRLAQREKAMNQLGDSSLSGASAVSIWDGNQAIKDKLAELWEQYTSSPNVGSSTSPWDTIDNQMISDASSALIQDYRLDVFQVSHVLYPKTVHLTVGSSILVIGVNSSTTTEQLISHLTEGARQLAEAK